MLHRPTGVCIAYTLKCTLNILFVCVAVGDIGCVEAELGFGLSAAL